MIYVFVPFPMTLDDHEGHWCNTGLIKCNRPTFVRYFAWFQLTRRVARSLGDSWPSCPVWNNCSTFTYHQKMPDNWPTMGSFFHTSIILSMSLSDIFLSDIVQRTIVNNLHYKKNRINRARFTLQTFTQKWRHSGTVIHMLIMISRESRARCDSVQQKQLMHIFEHVWKRFQKVVQHF